uniref:Putative lectin/glucanase superfamily protein n=1 Tax=viral metagenome TaxID=1070528 RepID=A0A6M3JV87_9ZZZZ
MRPTLERTQLRQQLLTRPRPTWALDPDLVLYLPFWNMPAGESWLSQDAYGHTVTRVGALATGQGGWFFDGSDDYATIPNAAPLNITGTAITFGAWVKVMGGALTNRFFISKSDGGWNAYHLSVGDANGFRPHLYTGAGLTYWDSTIIPVVGAWNRVLVTYNGTQIQMYVNGSLDSSRAATGNVGVNTGNLRVSTGRTIAEFPFNGYIGEVFVYKRALTALDIWNTFQQERGRYGV